MRRSDRRVRTTELVLAVPGLPPEPGAVRVVFLSDLHVGRMHVPLEDLLTAVEVAQPDVLLLGGDYTGGSQFGDAALDAIASLSEHCPTFGVLGNSDHNQLLDARQLRDILRESGGELLVNQAGYAHLGDTRIELIGVDEPRHGSPDVAAALEEVHGEADLRIGLSHSPALWREMQDVNAPISFFGHTHGGQVRLLGLEAHFTHLSYPRQLAAGLFRHKSGVDQPYRLASHWDIMRLRQPLRVSTEEGPLFYVSRGVGMGFLALRLSCPPEVVVAEFRAEAGAG
ncbi:MAG: hypothetical protein GF393_10520, partial [Armatimonadia bacterium]|nr:hypothetical protein [Armatimonadia bacterium]